MSWSRRDTIWKQGSVLARENFREAGLGEVPGADLAVAISHDCDIANDNLEAEPEVEFIFARIIEEKDGNLTLAKNPRVLHLSYTQEGSPIVLELKALRKTTVPKNILANFQPSSAYEMASRCQVLQSWLAARYRRHALPDSLDRRLQPVFASLEKMGKKNSTGILSYQLSYEPKGELSAEETYELWLTIVYITDDDQYKTEATDIAKDIQDNFSKLIENNKNLGSVDLRKCDAVSDMEFTLRDAREMQEYRLEYVSYRTDPPGPTL